MPSTDQYPISMATKQSVAYSARAVGWAAKYARNAPKMKTKLPCTTSEQSPKTGGEKRCKYRYLDKLGLCGLAVAAPRGVEHDQGALGLADVAVEAWKSQNGR